MSGFLGALLAQAVNNTAATGAVSNERAWVGVGIAAAIIVGSFIIGRFLARSWRMSDHDLKFAVIILALVAGVVVTVTSWPPKLGVDLEGGSYLVFEVDREAAVKGEGYDIGQLIAALRRRVDPSGTREIAIRQYGEDRVELVVPRKESSEVDEIVRQITELGTLEFRILSDIRKAAHGIQPEDIQEAALKLPKAEHDVVLDGVKVAKWVRIEDRDETVNDFVGPQGFGKDGAIVRPSARARDSLDDKGQPKPGWEVLVLYDEQNVEGKYLSSAYAGSDQRTGKPIILFNFSTEGANLFGRLTGEHLPLRTSQSDQDFWKLGVILNQELVTAPVIRSQITSSGEISGNFTQAEVDRVVAVLKAGSLPATLYRQPVARLDTGPSLGADTLQKAKLALIWSLGLVMLWMIFYYRLAGLIASLLVAFNILLMVAVSLAISSPFTLPGLAGLALTQGMSLDANVLIFERMREELARGSTLRMAIRNGFSRAMSAIIDSNITTLITATVLYAIGSDQIKGFAVMLWLGLVISLFTAVFCSRVIFDVGDRLRWITRINFMQLIRQTSIDFLAWKRFWVTASATVIILGILGMGVLGKKFLSIDYSGGVSVTLLFKTPQPIAEVREKLSVLGDVTVVDVSLTGQKGEAAGTQMRVETSYGATSDPVPGENVNQRGERLIREVKAKIAEIFPGQLDVNALTVASTFAITADAPKDGNKQDGDAKDGDAKVGDAKDGDAKDSDAKEGDAKKGATDADGDAGAAGSESDAAADGAGADDEKKEDAQPAEGDQSGVNRPDLRNVVAGGDLTTVLLALGAQNEGENSAAGDPPGEGEAGQDAPAGNEGEAAANEGAAVPNEGAAVPNGGVPGGGEAPVAEVADDAVMDDELDDEEEVDETAAALAASFVGGTQVQLKYAFKVNQETVLNQVRAALAAADLAGTRFDVSNPEYSGSSATFEEWDVKLALDGEATKGVLAKLQSSIEGQPHFPSASQIGGRVAARTTQDAIWALAVSVIAITIYLWVRYQKPIYGIASVVALAHDVFVTLAFLVASFYLAKIPGFATFLLIDEFKIDLTVTAAILTVMGYSLNDTIVVFDRIREVRGKSPVLTAEMVNLSVNQMLGRTLLTGISTLIPVTILYIWGGPSIHGFAYVMLIGIVTGTYSSIYIAAPVLLWVAKREQGRLAAPAAKETVRV